MASGQTLGVFESLGLNTDEEAAYLRVLRMGSSTLTALSKGLGWTKNRTGGVVASLEAKGLVTKTVASRPTMYPTPPEAAIEVLILRKQEEMERARIVAARLGSEVRAKAQSLDPLQLAEVVTGADAIDQRFQQLQRGAQTELFAFSKPPYLSPLENEDELELVQRGVDYRVIYDPVIFEIPRATEMVDQGVAGGVKARFSSKLPMKLVLFDRETALMPLSVEQAYETAALVIHKSAIVEALHMLFEMLWTQAVPYGRPLAGEGQWADDPVGIDRNRRLLNLLAAGIKDEAIARQMGHDPRTVRRYVSSLMKELGAETRFQAGLQAGKRGWL